MKTKKYNRKELSLALADKHDIPDNWEKILAVVYQEIEEKILKGHTVELYRIGKIIPKKYTNRRIRDVYNDDIKVVDKYTRLSFFTSYTLRQKINVNSKEIKRIKKEKENPFKKKR